MKPWLSATKIVFVMMSLTVCSAFLIGKLDAKDFMVLASMAFSFYFTQKIPGEVSK